MPWKRSDLELLRDSLPKVSTAWGPWLLGYTDDDPIAQMLRDDYQILLAQFPRPLDSKTPEEAASPITVFNLFVFSIHWLPLLEQLGLEGVGLSPGYVLKSILLQGHNVAAISSAELHRRLSSLIDVSNTTFAFKKLPDGYERVLLKLESLSIDLPVSLNHSLTREFVPDGLFDLEAANSYSADAWPVFYRKLQAGKARYLAREHSAIAHLCVPLMVNEYWFKLILTILKEPQPASTLKILTLSLLWQSGNLNMDRLINTDFLKSENPFNEQLERCFPVFATASSGDLITAAVVLVLHQSMGIAHLRELALSYSDRATEFEASLAGMSPWFRCDAHCAELAFRRALGDPSSPPKRVELIEIDFNPRSVTPTSVACPYLALSAGAASVEPPVISTP